MIRNLNGSILEHEAPKMLKLIKIISLIILTKEDFDKNINNNKIVVFYVLLKRGRSINIFLEREREREREQFKM